MIYKIIEILRRHESEVDNFNNAVFSQDYVKVATDIVEQLKADLKSELTDEMIYSEANEYLKTHCDLSGESERGYAKIDFQNGAKFARDFRPKDNDAIKFAEWINKNKCVQTDQTHPNKIGKWYSHAFYEYKTIEELYELFLTQNR